MSSDENDNSPNDSGLGFVFGAFSDEFDIIEKNFNVMKRVVTDLDARMEALDIALAFSINSLEKNCINKNIDYFKVFDREIDKKFRTIKIVTYTVLSSIVFVNILFMFYVLKGV